MLTDESGHITDSYTYDAWGNASHTYGYTHQPYEYVGQLGYYTHYQDANMGLLQLGVRFYDPGTGRFGQEDPEETALDAFVYCDDNPMRFVDPDGFQKREIPGCPDFTNKECRDACESISKRKAVQAACVAICNSLGGNTCVALRNRCRHYTRMGLRGKRLAEACYSLYHALNCPEKGVEP